MDCFWANCIETEAQLLQNNPPPNNSWNGSLIGLLQQQKHFSEALLHYPEVWIL